MLVPINEVKEIDQLKDFNTRIHEAAKLYARHGFPVVPLRPKSKILPPRNSGINYHSGSSKEETMNRWFGPQGKYQGYNLGLVCGQAAYVIDLDRHGENDGVANWKKLVKEYSPLNCPIQKTPSGGRHLILTWQPNMMSTSGKIDKGIDTRGGDGKPRSHVVLWPSEIEVEQDDGSKQTASYSWVKGGEVPDPPDWLVKRMGVAWTRNPGDAGRGNEEVSKEDEEFVYSPSHINAMLDSIDPNKLSYEEWLFVGQAINSQHPGSDGLELWQVWSERGERYKHGECQKRWPGFSPAGPIRVGTLIYLAKQGGYNPNTDPLARMGDFEELVHQMNEDNAVMLTGGKIRIAHRDVNGGIHIMGTHDFNILMYNKTVTVPKARAKVTEADIWMAHEMRRECINGMGFFPDKPLWHDGYVNMWRGWGVEAKQGDWSLFQQHILEVLCGGDQSLYDFVIDWSADIIQDPMRPKGTALVFHGKEGTGKGTFCHMLGEVIGRKHYKHVTNERHLTGNFNYHLMDGLLVFADEVIYGGSRSTAGILKSMVSEKELVCERKGIDSFMYENRTRLVVASNEDWFIPAGPESRRWTVLEVDDSKANDKDYFNAVYNQMESGGYEAMMYDLQHREIISNLNHAPETEALQKQRDIYKYTGDAADQWFMHCVAIEDLGMLDRGEGAWPSSVDRIELYETYVRWLGDNKGIRPKGPNHFYDKLEQFGFVKHRPGPKGGIRRWCYKTPIPDSFPKADDDEES